MEDNSPEELASSTKIEIQEILDKEVTSDVYDAVDSLVNDIANHFETKHNDQLREQAISHYREVKHLQREISARTESINRLTEEMLQQSKDHLKALDQKDKERRAEREAYQKMAIIRQAINERFDALWSKHEPTILSLNPDFNDLAKLTPLLKRPHLIKRSNGTKYALCILHDLCDHISKDLCNFYLSLNNSYHPIIKPDRVVFTAIADLKTIIKDGQIHPMFPGLKVQTLSELERVIRGI